MNRLVRIASSCSFMFLVCGARLVAADECWPESQGQAYQIYYYNPGTCSGCLLDWDMDFAEFCAFLNDPLFVPHLGNGVVNTVVADTFLGCGGSAHGHRVEEYFEFECNANVNWTFETTEYISAGWAAMVMDIAALGEGTVANLSNTPSGIKFGPPEQLALETAYSNKVLLVLAVDGASSVVALGQKKLACQVMNSEGEYKLGFDPTNVPTNYAVVSVPTEYYVAQPPPQFPLKLIARADAVHPGLANATVEDGSFSTPLVTGSVARVARAVRSRADVEPYTIERVLDYVISSCDRPDDPLDPNDDFSFRTGEDLPSIAPWSDVYAYGIYSPWKALIYAYGFGVLEAKDIALGGSVNPPTTFSDHFELRGDLSVPPQQEFIVSPLASVNIVTTSEDGPNLGDDDHLHEIVVEGNMRVQSSLMDGVRASILVRNGGTCTVEAAGTVTIDSGMKLVVADGGTLAVYGTLDISGTLIVNGTVSIANGADVRLLAGASIVVNSGGECTVNVGSSVQIDAGATVELNAGATLVADGGAGGSLPNEPTIELLGTLRVEDGAAAEFLVGTLTTISGTLDVAGELVAEGVFGTLSGAVVRLQSGARVSLGSDLNIAAGASLLVGDDVTVTSAITDANSVGADPTRVEITCAGRMELTGTSSSPIIFKAAAPGSSKWVGIKHNSTGSASTIVHVRISDAVVGLDLSGTNSVELADFTISACATGMKLTNRSATPLVSSDIYSCTTGVELVSSPIVLDDVAIHGTSVGVKCTNSSPTLRNCEIYANTKGVQTLDSVSIPFLGSESQPGNNNFGIAPLNTKHVVVYDPVTDILAQSNWWGTTNVSAIMNRIVNFESDPPAASVVIVPVLTQAPSQQSPIAGVGKEGQGRDIALAPDVQAVDPFPLELLQNVPNPFNPITQIGFTLDRPGRATVTIYDVSGDLVRTLVDERLLEGHHWRVWDGRNDRGEALSSGIYFYRLKTENTTLTRKAVIIK